MKGQSPANASASEPQPLKTLAEYRELLEEMRGGTVAVDYVLDEIIAAAEREIARSGVELTLSQAMSLSGRSRSYFEARLAKWQEQGLARKPGRDWLISRVVVPVRRQPGGEGLLDPDMSPEEIADILLDESR